MKSEWEYYMKKSAVCFLASALLLAGCASGKKENGLSKGSTLTDCITIKAEKKSFEISKTPDIALKDFNIFDICIDNVKRDEVVYLFAYHNTDYMNKYQLPIKTVDTENFAPGSGMAEYNLDPEKGYSLIMNSSDSFHYLFDERRINLENSCVIPVRKVTDPSGNFTDKICFSIFVDHNRDSIIQEEEYATFIISFKK